MQRGAYALTAFTNRFVGQTDKIELRQAVRGLHLHVDVGDIGALERNRIDTGDHVQIRFREAGKAGRNTDVLLTSRNEGTKPSLCQPVPEFFGNTVFAFTAPQPVGNAETRR